MSGLVHLPVTRRARLAVQRGAGPPAEGSPPAGGFSELWVLLHGYRQLAPRFLRHMRALHAPHRLLVAPEGLSRFYLEGRPGPHRGGDPVGASWMTREDREAEILDYVEYLDRVVEWGVEAARGRGGAGAPGAAGRSEAARQRGAAGEREMAARSDAAGEREAAAGSEAASRPRTAGGLDPMGGSSSDGDPAATGGLEAAGSGRVAPSLRVLGFSQGVHTAARWITMGTGVEGWLERGVGLVLWGAALPDDLPPGAGERLRALDATILVRGDDDALRSPEDEAAEEARLEEWGVPHRIRRHSGGHRIDGGLLAELAIEMGGELDG